MRVVAWVPIKDKSSRVPGKNKRLFAGKPLFRHLIDTLADAVFIEDVYVNTDSEDIRDNLLLDHRNKITVIDRPKKLSAPDLPVFEIMMNDFERMDADIVVLSHCTSPLLTRATLRDAVGVLASKYPLYDSVVSVTEYKERFYDKLSRPVNFNIHMQIPLQDMPPVYKENNAFFIVMPEIAITLHNRVGNRPYLYVMNPEEAVDIDNEKDFRYAEWLYVHGPKTVTQ